MAFPRDSKPEMSAEEFLLLRELIHEKSGILLRDDMKFMMERRLAPRLERLGIVGWGEYHRHLKFASDRQVELEAAIEALTTNETYFFREPVQLAAFSQELLPLLQSRNGAIRRLRIWSAGCSSGEEAYTIAMLVRESSLFDAWDVRIYGTDISKRMLAAARKGEYGAGALRATSPEQLRRGFEQVGTKWRVREEVRSLVSFAQLNLVDAEMSALVPRCDVIFCRNVFIYFDAPARKEVVRVFHEKLFEGGYLLLGHSETLVSLGADFELVHLRNDLVYRRP